MDKDVSARAVVALWDAALNPKRVKLVKQQLNGKEHTVVKTNASTEDLRAEALRMKNQLGYEVQADDRLGRYIATHSFFRGKFVLMLEQD